MEFTTRDGRTIVLGKDPTPAKTWAVYDTNDVFAETPSGKAVNKRFNKRSKATAYFEELKETLS